jgi:hypothetical protein
VTPSAHLAGTLALFDAIASLAGGHPQASRVRAFIDRAAPPGRRDDGLKYDAYLACGDAVAWGITVNDRGEREPFKADLERLADDWGYDLGMLERWQRVLEPRHPVLTAAFGFDAAVRAPRLKLYLQEDAWGRGLCRAGDLGALLASVIPGVTLPLWLKPERAIGVVCLVFEPNGTSAKIYCGGSGAIDAARGAPSEAQRLASDMAAACPLGDSFYYLTLRLAGERPPAYAINKIYNPMRLARAAAERDRALDDVAELFRLSACDEPFAELRRMMSELEGRGVRVVPTATALERGSRSADVYLAAWSTLTT